MTQGQSPSPELEKAKSEIEMLKRLLEMEEKLNHHLAKQMDTTLASVENVKDEAERKEVDALMDALAEDPSLTQLTA